MISDPYTTITAGQSVKVPMCEDSQCTLVPYRLQYGTYVDIAREYGTTVGQIQAINPTYSHSDAELGPAIAVPIDCVSSCGDNCTTIT